MKKERLWSPIFIGLLFIGFLSMAASCGTSAGASIYMVRIGEGTSLAGLGALIYQIASAVARLAVGPTIDQRGRGIVMICGSVLTLVGTILPAFDVAAFFFIAGRLIQGIGVAAVVTASATAVADVLPQSRMGEGIGYFGMAQALSMAVGPAIAVALANSASPLSLFFGMGVLVVAGIILSLIDRYEKHPQKLSVNSTYRMRWENGEISSTKAAHETSSHVEEVAESSHQASATNAGSKVIQWLISVFEVKAFRGALPMLIIAPIFSFNVYFMGVYGSEMSIENVGVFFVVLSISMAANRFLSGRFIDAMPPVKLMLITVIFGLIGYGMALSCSFVEDQFVREALFYTMGIPTGICTGLAMPLCQFVSIKSSPADRWGAANGVFYFSFDLGGGLASLFVGIILETIGYIPAIISVLVCVAVSFPVAWICFPKRVE